MDSKPLMLNSGAVVGSPFLMSMFRFGITPCCLDDLDKTIIQKEICDWNSKWRQQEAYPTNEEGKFIAPFEVVSVKDEPCTDPLPTETNCVVNLQTIVNEAFVDGNCTRDLNKNGLTTEEFIKNIENKLLDFHSKRLSEIYSF